MRRGPIPLNTHAALEPLMTIVLTSDRGSGPGAART